MHMFRNWISSMGRGFSTAARTALVALACIGPAEAANFTLTLKVSPTGAGAGVPKAGPGRARGGTARGRPLPRDAQAL